MTAGYLGIDEEGEELCFLVFWSWWQLWSKPEEDVDCHGVNPEHEGRGGVESDIASEYTGVGVVWKKVSKVSAEEATSQAYIGDEVIEKKANGDLSKERAVKVTVHDVGNESKE